MPYRATKHTRAKQAATRERILDAARQLLSEGGYAAVQVAVVAQRAGVATGTVYRYFPSKGELFAEVFRHICDREVDVMRSGAVAPGTYRQRLLRVLRVFAVRALQSQRIAHALIAEPVEPEVDVERLRFRDEYQSILAQLIRSAQIAGECGPTDPDLVAAFLVGGIAQSLIAPPNWAMPDKVIDSITHTVEKAVFGDLDAPI